MPARLATRRHQRIFVDDPPSAGGTYNSGGVNTDVRYSIDKQGAFSYTTSSTDLAVDGQGFFIVSGSDGTDYLTRAGNFEVQEDGSLKNSAGFTLMGYPTRPMKTLRLSSRIRGTDQSQYDCRGHDGDTFNRRSGFPVTCLPMRRSVSRSLPRWWLSTVKVMGGHSHSRMKRRPIISGS